MADDRRGIPSRYASQYQFEAQQDYLKELDAGKVKLTPLQDRRIYRAKQAYRLDREKPQVSLSPLRQYRIELARGMKKHGSTYALHPKTDKTIATNMLAAGYSQSDTAKGVSQGSPMGALYSTRPERRTHGPNTVVDVMRSEKRREYIAKVNQLRGGNCDSPCRIDQMGKLGQQQRAAVPTRQRMKGISHSAVAGTTRPRPQSRISRAQEMTRATRRPKR